jgi:peptidoglycan/xylan/chitin deacetylase (PgdA/CDA1 family)
MSLRRRTDSLLGRALIASNLHRLLLGGGGLVLTFHRVSDDLAEDGLTRSSRDFERFCRFFQANFDVVTLSEIVSRLERREALAGAVAITFDDGYLDNFEIAAPILQGLSLPATFFVVTQFMGSETVAWWDRDLPRPPGWMTWDQVRELSRAGFDIGAHTRTHPDLGKIEGAVARQEIAGARAELTEQLGRAPEHFAYPYGQRDHLLEANRELVKEAGFRSCVSCYGGVATCGADPYSLHRIPVARWYRTPEQFAFEQLTRRW